MNATSFVLTANLGPKKHVKRHGCPYQYNLSHIAESVHMGELLDVHSSSQRSAIISCETNNPQTHFWISNDKWVKITLVTSLPFVFFNALLSTEDNVQTVKRTVTIRSWYGPALFQRNVIFSWQLHIKNTPENRLTQYNTHAIQGSQSPKSLQVLCVHW